MVSISGFAPLLCVVGFHHARGPEIESWYGIEDDSDPIVDNDWSYLPFMALSDGSHATTENFSYFTLRRHATGKHLATSVFGISCMRQVDAKELIHRSAEVTRSTVQKAVVVIADSPQYFGLLKEKLSVITRVWFEQKDFTNVEILKEFQESLAGSLQDTDDDRDQYLGIPIRELIHEYKHQILVLFKCCLLQPKMLFFGTQCERLCMVQFSLISLIPGLLRKLGDSSDPELDDYGKNLAVPTSLRTSDRSSMLSYMGLPLQIFGKGSLFGPYTPLQQLDTLADYGTKSYIVGSTNSLLLQQKDHYSDVLINVNDSTVNISSTSLRAALTLSAADRRWIDFLIQTVYDTWDDENPSRPKAMGYMGSEESIRLQFEEYLLAFLASVKYHLYLHPKHSNPPTPIPTIEGDPSSDFNPDFIHAWCQTSSFALFDTHTDPYLFNVVEPCHPTAGALSLEDLQRRLATQIQTLHLDERLAASKEVLNKHLAQGQKKVSTALANIWADIEEMRESQRRRLEEQKSSSGASADSDSMSQSASSLPIPLSVRRVPDLSHAQASVAVAGQKAGAFISSWGTWAAEKRKGWGNPRLRPGSEAEGESATSPVRLKEKEKVWDGVGSPGKNRTKAERGGDGIGRLDA